MVTYDNDILVAYMELTGITSIFEAINILDWCEWDIDLAIKTYSKYLNDGKEN